MNKANRVLLMLIAMAAIMLAAVGIDRGIKFYKHKQWEKERESYYLEARTDIARLQEEILTLSEDMGALTEYFEDNELNYIELPEEQKGAESGSKKQEGMFHPEELWELEEMGRDVSDNDASENGADVSSASENEMQQDGASGNNTSENNTSGNSLSENQTLENNMSVNSASGNNISGNSISGNDISENSMLSNGISGNGTGGSSVSGNGPARKLVCASYETTIRVNHADKDIIAGRNTDFSGKKIACLGDSITEATNLSEKENYMAMSYPYQLKEILQADTVVNLGIGGSSIGRYWENAFVDRYREIPADTDIIIVMGGTNDGFCASEAELGSLEERKKRTFAGDLDELLKGLKKDYPDAEIFLATPLPNVLHDMLRREREFLCPQSAFAEIIRQLGAEYGIPVIDLYASGILDSHDVAVVYNFIPDGVHGNELGYRVLAEHMAAEIIQFYERKQEAENKEGEPENER